MTAAAIQAPRGRRIADAAIAAVVVLVVGMMIVPLPTPLLDLLLTANISIGVLLLLVALYLKEGLAFSSFPTILLVTTLYRLALNVSSTRLILLQADAGEVIDAFGHFVVRGNYVVGAVVFAILTLIQFIVVAKGSERVAEVGARFTLDAMPGKQMSIDADLRAGALTQEQARAKREALSRESQFYGAMDGAMKFVKGDAIAGIVITVVNIVGGLAVGVGMRDMTVTDSLQRYGLLTIGDGLVSQIPALLISTAAGLVVTRVASEDESSSLGGDVSRQLFGDRRALAAAAVFLVALAIVPGLPALPFLVIGACFFALSRAPQSPKATGEARPEAAPSRMPIAAPIVIEVGAPADPGSIEGVVAATREKLFAELGFAMPPARVLVRGDGEYAIYLQEVIAETGVFGDEAPALRVERALVELMRRRAHELFGIDDAQAMLSELERAYPSVVRNAVPKPVPLPLFTDVLKRLLEEGVSIRSLREILEVLARDGASERDPVALTELVRQGLRRRLTASHARGGALHVYLVDPGIEETIRDAIQRTTTGSYLALSPDVARDVIAAIKRACVTDDGDGRFVLLTQSDVRRYLRRLIETELPRGVVLSYSELAPETMVQPLGRVEP